MSQILKSICRLFSCKTTIHGINLVGKLKIETYYRIVDVENVT